MKRSIYFISILFISLISTNAVAQNYGEFAEIKKDLLLLDFELLKQGLEEYHTGIYWYTPKVSFDSAFTQTEKMIDRDMNVLEFHRIIAPLIALTKEDHTDIYLPQETNESIIKQAEFLPLTVKFLGTKLYCIGDGSESEMELQYREIESINGETPVEIVSKIGTLYANDGFIQPVKLNDLTGFNFAKYHYFYYGNVGNFIIELKDEDQPVNLEALLLKDISLNLNHPYEIMRCQTETKTIPLKFFMIADSIAYLGIQTFNDDRIKKDSEFETLKKFLEESFRTISRQEIKTLIIDVSENGGGNEGNEGLLCSYLGENYQKYTSVKAKTQKVVLNNGMDPPVKFKTFGFLERVFTTKKVSDGSFERRDNAIGPGLMAYKKSPKYKFEGNAIFVIIGPNTYSGGSEFANMVYSQSLATFVGQETGGGYYGNTSGYSKELVLPHSKIKIEIPALQFEMNVKNTIPFGRGVIPDYEVIPTIEQFKSGENVALNYILNRLMAE